MVLKRKRGKIQWEENFSKELFGEVVVGLEHAGNGETIQVRC
jgi:hypothetical protein